MLNEYMTLYFVDCLRSAAGRLQTISFMTDTGTLATFQHS